MHSTGESKMRDRMSSISRRCPEFIVPDESFARHLARHSGGGCDKEPLSRDVGHGFSTARHLFRTTVQRCVSLLGQASTGERRIMQKNKKWPLVSLLLMLAAIQSSALAQAPAPHPLSGPDVETWLDGYFPYALYSGDIAGAVVVVVKDGQILFEKGYGYADYGVSKPVDPKSTLFRWGSVSKLFTWTAVMQLVEQGKIDLDVDVNQYLDFKIPPRQGKPVTMRNIMTHTAGFEERLKGLIGVEADGVKPLGQFMKLYLPARILAPGETP